jgi:hypothetical protein
MQTTGDQTPKRGASGVRWIIMASCLGLIVSVLVSWVCAAFIEMRGDVKIPDSDVLEMLRHRGFTADEQSDFYGAIARGFGVTGTSAVLEEEEWRVIIVKETGWPFRSVKGEARIASTSSGNSPYVIEYVGAIRFGAPQQYAGFPVPSFLPITPRWNGLLLDTLVYSVLILAAMLLPPKLRHALRRRRGLCPSCRYPTGLSSVCSECGLTLR